MTTVVCPHCRQSLTAHASPHAVLVRCPACGQPFTVPAAASTPPAASSEPWVGMCEKARGPRRKARSGPMAAFAVMVGLAVMVAAGVYVGGVVGNKDDGQVAAAVKEEPKPKPEIRWPEKTPVRKKETAKKDVAQPSIERKKWTFDEAYAEAEKMADRLTEPAATETAATLKILTAIEGLEARALMGLEDEYILDGYTSSSSLRSKGLTAFLGERSRKLARKDPKFKAVIETLLAPAWEPLPIVLAMSNWGEIGNYGREMVPPFVFAGKRPFDPMTRDDILLLGGRKWLESLP